MILTNKKAALISPILGSIILTLMSLLYSFCLLDYTNYKINNFFNSIINILYLLPTLLIIFSFISYSLSFSLGFIIYKINNYLNLSQGFFWFFSFLFSLLISLLFFDNKNLVKSIFIVISLIMMGTFNSSLFSVLTGKVKIKNDTKGTGT